jgi:hypothetical protein
MAVTNALDRHEMMVFANEPIPEQLAHALPSALPAPDVTGNFAVDVAIQVASTFGAAETARRSTSATKLIGAAVTAQVLSCAADAGVDRTGWLLPREHGQPDVGFSAINAAWFSMFLLDRADRAQTPLRRNLWRAGMATFAGAMTLGCYFLMGPTGEKLDLSSHATGIGVGAAAYLLGKRKEKRRELNQSQQIENQEEQVLAGC